MTEFTYGAVRRILARNGAGLLFVKRKGRPRTEAFVESASAYDRWLESNRENRFSSAPDTALPSIAGAPGSAERIESLRTFYAVNDECSAFVPNGDETFYAAVESFNLLAERE